MLENANKYNLAWIPILFILYNFSANLSNDIYLPSMPRLAEVFATTPSMLQLTMTAWFAGAASPQLFFGPFTDRFGRRPVLIGGGICFLLATAICAIAPNIFILIIGRFLQGVGVCSLNVSCFSILVDLYEYKRRTQILNKINMVGVMAPLMGPLLGGYILAYLGWRANFLVILFLGAISVAGLWWKLPESNLQLNPQALHLRHMHQNYFALLKNPKLLKNLLPYCFLLGGLIVYLTASPFLIIEVFHFSVQSYGYLQLPIFTAYIAGSFYLDYANDDAEINKILMMGVKVAFIASSLMLLLAYVIGNNILLLIIPMTLYSLGFGFCASALVTEVTASATNTKGSASALLGFGMAMSCMISSFLTGILYDGKVLAIAILLFIFSSLASCIYFFNHCTAVKIPSHDSIT